MTELTALFIYSKGCGSCVLFKSQFETGFKKILASKGIKSLEYEAESVNTGLGNNVKPRFLSVVKFFPCIILIETSILRSADLLSLNLVLSLISVFNGDILKLGSPRFIEPNTRFKMNDADITTFVTEFMAKRATEDAILGRNDTTRRTATVTPQTTVSQRPTVQLINGWGK